MSILVDFRRRLILEFCRGESAIKMPNNQNFAHLISSIARMGSASVALPVFLLPEIVASLLAGSHRQGNRNSPSATGTFRLLNKRKRENRARISYLFVPMIGVSMALLAAYIANYEGFSSAHCLEALAYLHLSILGIVLDLFRTG